MCDGSAARYVGSPAGEHNVSVLVDTREKAAFLTPQQWGETVYVFGNDIVPQMSYEVVGDCGSGNPGGLTVPILTEAALVETDRWGDTVGTSSGNGTSPPDGQVDFQDIAAVVDGFVSSPNAPPLYQVDLFGCVPDQVIDFTDIAGAVDAFTGADYVDTRCPVPCP